MPDEQYRIPILVVDGNTTDIECKHEFMDIIALKSTSQFPQNGFMDFNIL